MIGPNRLAITLALLATALLLGGCRPPAAPPPQNSRASVDPIEFDVCIERLHDIEGHLLMYYAVNKQLPQTLGDLRRSRFSETVLDLTCPVSREAYIYNRQGLTLPNREGRLIIYDTKPCHNGSRWAILLEPMQPGQPLLLRILRVPETAVQWNAPATTKPAAS